MNQLINYISDFFGIIMRQCYMLVGDYGIAIIIFTVFTKFALFPVSLVTQKNAIKMAQMKPQLATLKTQYIDDKDRYTDEQLKLFKENKYHPLLDLIPLLIQILIVLGLVGVMYRPLSYVLGIDRESLQMLQTMYLDSKTQQVDNYYQLSLIHNVQNGYGGVPGKLTEIVDQIRSFNMKFLGFDLSETPELKINSYLFLIPLFSGISAWLMCIVQNKINILQLYAGKVNKIGMTIFMIAFSTYFAFLVPAGVGLYWILGNIFSIPVMYLVNMVIPPQKYVNMEYIRILNETEVEQERVRKKYGKLEKKDSYRFEHTEKKIVFYAESKGFYKYYEAILDYLGEKNICKIDYVTSDAEDPILKKQKKYLRTYYVARDKYLIPLFMKLDCDICVMTMPDLEKYHIKRSKIRKDIEYIYVAHGMGSNALTLRKGALDNYDTVFCVGIDAVNEIRQMEELYNTKEKTLVETGYTLLDQMILQYNDKDKVQNNKKTILIAPSWQPNNIIDLCIEKILNCLKDSQYDVIVRPHPQQVRHQMKKFIEMKDCYEQYKNIKVQIDFSSNDTVMDADLLITDWSDISFEYAFVTLKPVLFIETPMKIMNPEYDRIEQIPINISLRNILGKSITIQEIENILLMVDSMLNERAEYRQQIFSARETHVFNIGKSIELSGRYIIKRLKHKG